MIYNTRKSWIVIQDLVAEGYTFAETSVYFCGVPHTCLVFCISHSRGSAKGQIARCPADLLPGHKMCQPNDPKP